MNGIILAQIDPTPLEIQADSLPWTRLGFNSSVALPNNFHRKSNRYSE